MLPTFNIRENNIMISGRGKHMDNMVVFIFSTTIPHQVRFAKRCCTVMWGQWFWWWGSVDAGMVYSKHSIPWDEIWFTWSHTRTLQQSLGGRPSQKRKKSGWYLKKPLPSNCSACNETDHDAQNCPVGMANPENIRYCPYSSRKRLGELSVTFKFSNGYGKNGVFLLCGC